jgi:hypothetical protein
MSERWRSGEDRTMLRSLDSPTCDSCSELAVDIVAIGRQDGEDLLKAVCSKHLELMLRGAKLLAPTPAADPSWNQDRRD